MKKTHASFLVTIFILSGCTQYQWQKNGMTREGFNKDNYECQKDAAYMYPAQYVTEQVTSGYRSPSTTNCTSTGNTYSGYNSVYGSSNIDCTTTPGTYSPGYSTTSDVNSGNRSRAFKQCMNARGYEYASQQLCQIG